MFLRWRDLAEEESERIVRELYQKGGYDPVYGKDNDAMPGISIVDEVEDRMKMAEERTKKRKNHAGVAALPTTSAVSSFTTKSLIDSREKII